MNCTTRPRAILALSVTVFLYAGPAPAADSHAGMHYEHRFERIATLPNFAANPDPAAETVSEIVAATRDGDTLVYTDGEREAITLVDVTDPASPEPLATLDVGGEPTSVAVLGDNTALVSVNTSASFTDTSGVLLVVDIRDPSAPSVRRQVQLRGQPDAVSVSPDGRYTAVAIENERDEEICVGGSSHGDPVPEDDDEAAARCEAGGGVPGGLPQTDLGNPAGYLSIVDNENYSVRQVALTGLADFAPDDPEPEFVDVNGANHAVVTLQENNHLVIVDLERSVVTGHFTAGEVSLEDVDTVEDDVIALDDRLVSVPREPDAVTWVGSGGGAPLLATANEGDLRGGSRGFTLFDMAGNVVFDSGNAYEHLAVSHGHYPEDRSGNKGTEPEGVAFGRFGEDEFLFVSSERGSFVAVYEMWGTQPRFLQLLPAPLGPEGVLPIPGRDLLVVSGEEDDPEYGVRSTLMIYRLQDGAPAYPQIVSVDDPSGRPISWSALSGLTAAPGGGDRLLAVQDSYYRNPPILVIDASERPGVIVDTVSLSGTAGRLDAEGIAIAPDGSHWLASEGDDPGKRPNLLLQLDADGKVMKRIGLPERIEDCRAQSTATGSLDNGFEGVAAATHEGGYRLLAAQQLPWLYTSADCEALGDQAGMTRVWHYSPATGQWGHITYQLADVPENASWVGLSEITRAPDGSYLLIERDNLTGVFSELKQLVRVTPEDMADGSITRDEKETVDLLPELRAGRGWVTDKPEGLAVTDTGSVYLVTDNDGVDDWSGETSFLNLGRYEQLF